ncbi:RBP protein [Aspergillus pseudonomiae]|uniref:RBP protein n=1 Tax=Aspergillus pseudonomiae TaxID=1506151 RepID=A0A5N6HGZ4_9EURO|nr:RBP protein [Aspergillus pseudonomiae]KAB8253575.1 RBP protein [Aspergillus pseudonomiae]KAE8404680.1 RBP protein [Aspergillus pseudonomiae]
MAAAAAMTPPPPTEILHLDTATGYRWILSEAERAHIASLLKTETDAITIRGNIMTQERRVCAHCGKHSGLDDLVHNALALGIHSDGFMLDVLQHGPKNTSPPHNLLCSNCGEQHEGTFLWIPSLPW